MKNLTLTTTIVCGFGLTAASASARDFEQDGGAGNDYRMAFTWPWSHKLSDEINHLNRMRGHVRWQLRNYRGNQKVRQDFLQVSKDIDHINSQFRERDSDQRHLRHEVERTHAELHRIELALHVKARDFYPWR